METEVTVATAETSVFAIFKADANAIYISFKSFSAGSQEEESP